MRPITNFIQITNNVQILKDANRILITPPAPFDFYQCLSFMNRSDKEILHRIDGAMLSKLIKIDEALVLLRISYAQGTLKIVLQGAIQDDSLYEKIALYVWELFDLEKDLSLFYSMAEKDPVLNGLIKTFSGLRVVRIPDLFEAITWAITGQQINLAFAYTLKRRFVETFGEKFEFEGHTYWLYPTPEVISELSSSDLMSLQFTSRKAEYILGIAKLMANGTLLKDNLIQKGAIDALSENHGSYEDVMAELLALRGIGKWSADYVIMKCLGYANAFPIADVGLHNSLKTVLKLDKKPSIEDIQKLALNWKGWEAYATFYLWRLLY
jgi:DNA-3-methyladenine glycosylase II